MKIEMKTINLSEDQNKNLSDELLKLVQLYSSKDKVECIYYLANCYIGTGMLKTINLKIVTSDSNIDFEKNIDKYNSRSSSKIQEFIEKFGVEIYLSVDLADRYTLTPHESDKYFYSELESGKCLFNGTILYDNSGKFRLIQDNIVDSAYYPKDFIKKDYPTAYINPPLNVNSLVDDTKEFIGTYSIGKAPAKKMIKK